MLALIVDREGDPVRERERLLRVVRPGDMAWTWVLEDEKGREIVRHHDAIRNAWDLARKKPVGGKT